MSRYPATSSAVSVLAFARVRTRERKSATRGALVGSIIATSISVQPATGT